MADLPPSLLVRRGQRLHVALAVSAALHAIGLGAAFFASSAGAEPPRLNPDKQPIAAKLVRLGEERDPNLLPTKEQPPPPPPPPEQATPPAPPPEEPPPPPPEPVETKSIAPTKKAPEPVPEDEPSPPPERPSTPDRSDPGDLDSVVREFIEETDPDSTADDRPIYGSPDGDPYGTHMEGSEGDRYLALVTRALRRNYRVPSIIPERERMFLNATVVIYVGANGRILRKEIERPSGNPHFDAALMSAVEASNPLPPPPRGWAERFEREGLGVNFRL